MKPISTLLAALLLVVGCTKETEEMTEQFVVSTRVLLVYQNAHGQDLLSSSTPGHYPLEQMRLYYLLDGEKVLVPVESHLDLAPLWLHEITISDTLRTGLGCFTSSDRTKNVLSSNNGITRGFSVSYIDFGNGIVDTLKTEWEAGPNYFINQKVRLNNQVLSFEQPTSWIIRR